MNISELRSKSVKELDTDLEALYKQQFQDRMDNATGQKANNHVFKQTRRSIARIKTLIHEKQGE